MKTLPDNLKNNILLNPPKQPHDAPVLKGFKIEDFMPAIKFGIEEAREQVEQIKTSKDPATFENTIEALEFAGTRLGRVMSIFSNIASADSTDEIRAIENDINQELVKYGNDIMLDADLFKRVKDVYDAKDSLKLDAEQKQLLEETYKGFVRSGALLNDEDKQELRGLSEKLSELSTKYKNNSVESTDAFQKVIEDESELAGVPERAKNIYKSMAEEAGMKGKFLIKLSPPPIDILEYGENRELREEMYRAMTSVAYKDKFDNSPIILEMVKLRKKVAKLMGFGTYADMVLDDRMAKKSDTVMEFLEKNKQAYRPAAEDYLKKVQDYAEKKDGLKDLQPWDFGFYSRQLKEETFGIKMEDLRPYFKMEDVLEGLRKHAEELFNIDFVETKDKYQVYDPDVKVYEVKNKDDGSLVGLFYADYFARPGRKSGGAWMNTFRNRGDEQGENKFSIVTNVCNFSKPTKDQPSLLSVDDVITVFHEFGHGLHALLAEGKYPSLTGTNVKWDFVELPSQLQENWAMEKMVLDTFAKHYKTGEQLSENFINKIKEMENFDAGYRGLRQTFLGLLDMKYHAGDADKIDSVEKLEDKLVDEAWLFPRAAGTMSTNFGHLFAGGYAAGYYSYKWAEVLEADIFEMFAEKGLYHRETADRLRETIYSKGGTKDPMELFVEMRGREPDPEALFRREGLAKKAQNNNDKTARPPKHG